MKTWHILTVTVLLSSGCSWGPVRSSTFQEIHERSMSIESGVTTKAEIIQYFGKPFREFHSQKWELNRSDNRVLMFYHYSSMSQSGNSHNLTVLIGDDERVIKYMHDRLIGGSMSESEPLNVEALKQLRKGSSDEEDIIRLLGTPRSKGLDFHGNTCLNYSFFWKTDSSALREVFSALLTVPYAAYVLTTGDSGTSSAWLSFILDENGKLKNVSGSQQKGFYERKDITISE